MIFMYFLKIVILFSPFIKDSIYMNIHILELNVAVSCSCFEEIEQLIFSCAKHHCHAASM